MKFALTPLFAAAVMTAGAAQATPVGVGEPINGGPFIFLEGQGTLAFNPGEHFDGVDLNTIGGLIAALNVGHIQVSPLPPVMQPQVTTVADEFGDPVRVGTIVSAPVTSIDVGSAGQMLQVSGAGGVLMTATRLAGTLTGGSAAVTNLRFDLANRVVYADLAGRSNGVGTRPAMDYVMPNTALWTFDAVFGPTTLPTVTGSANLNEIQDAFLAAGFSPSGNGLSFTAENTILSLKVTQQGFDFFSKSLGLLSAGRDAFNAVNNDPLGWGLVKSSVTISVVPEPSTWLMAVAGLAAAGAITRRRGAGQEGHRHGDTAEG